MECTICKHNTDILFDNLSDQTHTHIAGTYTLKNCKNCNLIFVDPQPSMKKLSEHYPDDYHVYIRSSEKISASKATITKMIAKNFFGYGRKNYLLKAILYPFYYKLLHLPHFKKDGLLLDIGCGTGTRLPTFELLGWQVEGVEPSKPAAEVGVKRGYKIHNGFFDQLNFPDNYCDAIYLNNVFEHIPDLHGFLSKAASVLKNNGELILVVPNTKSLTFKLFRKDWYALDVPRHLYNFDEVNLSTLLRSHNFSLTNIKYCNFLGSLSSSIAIQHNKNPGEYSRYDKLIWLTSLLFDPITNYLKAGDWLVLHARIRK